MKTFILLFCILFCSAIAIGPYNFSSPSGNVYAVIPKFGFRAPDARVEVSVESNGPKIPLISYLVKTVHSLMNLGLEDFSRSMSASSWTFDDIFKSA